MRKMLLVLLLLWVGGVCVSAATAYELSADIVGMSGGNTMISKMYMKGNNVRWETPEQDTYTIVRTDQGTSWLVMPGQRMYMEMKPDPSQRIPGERMEGEVSRKLIGTEVIDGHPTEKYEVTYRDDGEEHRMFQWMATDLNFPVKTASGDGSWSMEFRNIKMGSQPEDLFEVPAGYRKMALPVTPGAGMGKGMSPGDMKGFPRPPGNAQ
ncbi:MAG: hypothetical protein JXO48_02110 [Deltaproteobacteria bacterium]|nr:hypothetical protein [Deltaproteobacteria bacterium]